MTKDEARKAAEVMLAYAEGKEIEFKRKEELGESWQKTSNLNFNFEIVEYRIKPEPKYRPFKDAEECWQEMQKHQPFGWVKDNENGYYTFIGRAADGDNVILGASFGWNYKNVFEAFTFADGTPFGKLTEEE